MKMIKARISMGPDSNSKQGMAGDSPSCLDAFGFRFFSPVRRRVAEGGQGVVGEDCLSAKREFRSRLTSRATQGTA
jgi:hypothetical protein